MPGQLPRRSFALWRRRVEKTQGTPVSEFVSALRIIIDRVVRFPHGFGVCSRFPDGLDG